MDEMPLSIARWCWSVRMPDCGGEAEGLRRRDIDPLRSRIRVRPSSYAGGVTLDNEPKTTRSKRSVPLAPSVMRRLELPVGVG